MDLSGHLAFQKNLATRIAKLGSRLSISLSFFEDKWFVQSVEYSSSKSVHRSTFYQDNEIADILCGELAEAIIAQIDEDSGFRDIVLPGLRLGKAKITKKLTRNTSLTVRFSNCVGNIGAAFRAGFKPWQMGHDQSELVAAETLSSVLLPLMNLSSDPGPVSKAGEANSNPQVFDPYEKIKDLELYYNILVDFVAASADGQERRTESTVRALAGL